MHTSQNNSHFSVTVSLPNALGQLNLGDTKLTKVWHQAGQCTGPAHFHTHVQMTALRHARHVTLVSGLLPVPLKPISGHVAKPKWELQIWSVWVLQQQECHLFCAGTAMSQHPKNPATTGGLISTDN